MTKQEKLSHVQGTLDTLKDMVQDRMESLSEEQLNTMTALDLIKGAVEYYEEMMKDGDGGRYDS